ncbi:MAG TPA: flagellar hook-length control protein FliK, partial [Tepidisphaeraceae bacterium]|nr:flagellar hook-length control protein FliK [Tepidisphaeraceae bacterium]
VAAGPHVPSRAPDDLLLKTPGPETTTPGVPAKPADLRSAVANTADPTAAAGAAPEAQFADANHTRIVAGIHGQLLPNGGSMHIRLDPPELGSLHVRVEMRDGVMTASFETTNDHATRLLSHSLSDLKTALESQGVNVDKLQVRQSPKDQQSSSNDRQPDRSQDQARQQEQQRKEMVRRMWQKLMNGSDPLDLVA